MIGIHSYQMRKDGRVVEGVALEMLCRLLSTEGSNPSFSVAHMNGQDKWIRHT
jgi:hypothetical protein